MSVAAHNTARSGGIDKSQRDTQLPAEKEKNTMSGEAGEGDESKTGRDKEGQQRTDKWRQETRGELGRT